MEEDPCDYEPAPEVAFSPASLSLAVGETKTTTVSYGNGWAYMQPTGGTRGTFKLTGNTLSYTATSAGSDWVTVYAQNACYIGVNRAIIITVTPGVTAANGALTAPYNAPTTLTLPVSGNPSSVTITTPPSKGVASISGSTLTYQGDVGQYAGTDTLTYTANGAGGPKSGVITITMQNPANPTIQGPASVTTHYGKPVTITFTTTSVVTNWQVQNTFGNETTVRNGNEVTFTPNPNQLGAGTLRATVSGPSGVTSVANVALVVEAPPIIQPVDATWTAQFETPVSNKIATSLGRDLAMGEGVVSTPPSHGTAVESSGGNFTYTPAPGYIGPDSFVVTATNEIGETANATITVNVAAPAAPTVAPAASSGAYMERQLITLATTGPITSYNVTAAAHGTAAQSLGVLEYTPAKGFYGTDSVEVTATGPGGASPPARMDFTVAKQPVIQPAAATWTAAFETPVTSRVYSSLGQTIAHAQASVTTPAAHGLAEKGLAANWRYTPAPGFAGTDQFEVTATNDHGETATATITVNVTAPAAPIATGGSVNTGYQQPVTYALPSSGHVTSYALSGSPVGGTASLSAGDLTFTPAPGFIGAGSVDYTVTGAGGVSGLGQIVVNVASPGAPTIQNGTASIEQDGAASLPLTVTGVYSTLRVVDAPEHGSVSIAGTTATYQPDPGWTGTDEFTVEAVGPGGTAPLASFSVTVAEPPPPPPPPTQTCDDGTVVTAPATCPVKPAPPVEVIEARPGEASTPLNTPIAMNLMRLVQGAPVASLDVVEQAKRGHVEIEGGEAVYTPRENVTGEDSFIYRATAESGATAQARVTVVVEQGSVPTVTDVRIEVIAGVPYTVDLAPAGVGGPFEGADLVQAPSKGEATTTGTVLTYTAPIDFDGEANMSFVMRNSWGPSEPALLVATVLPAALPAADLRATVLQGKTVEIDLTNGARGGPFTGATIAAFDAATGNATIERRGDRLVLVFSSKGTFFGPARIGYTLANARTVSAMAFAIIEVVERENPAQNREVTALVNAQATTAQRFGESQLGNVVRRLEGTHGGRRESTMSIGLPREREILGFEEEARRSFAADVDKALGRATDPVTAAGPRRAGETGDVAVWVGGSLDLGRARGNAARSKARFTTGGLSAGVDASIGDKVIIGSGFGFGNDKTKIGDKGTESSATSVSVFGYGSYQPGKATFFDAVLGLSKIDFESERYIEATGNLVSGQRRGQQVFGAVSAGWEHNGPKLMLSPYGRLQFVFTDLSGFVEQGDDSYALAFLKQTLSDVEAAIGLRGQASYDLKVGELLPAFRIEYRQKLHTGGVARMRYADWDSSPIYSTQPYFADESSFLLGVGGSYRRGDWTFGGEVETTAGNSGSQTTRVRASGSTKF